MRLYVYLDDPTTRAGLFGRSTDEPGARLNYVLE